MLTNLQQELLDLLFETKTQAKVLRRKVKEDGSFEFYDLVRDTRPIDFPVNEEEFAIKIHQVQPDTPLSPIYVNLRNLPENVLGSIGKVMSEIEFEDQPDVCTGIPKTAIAMAEKFAGLTGIPFVDIYEKMGTDTNRTIETKEGAPKGEGKKLVIIDDVVSQAKSKYEAIKVAEDLGYKVVGILVLVDREQGGAKELGERGYKVYAPLTLTKVISYYLENGKITKEQYDQVLEYLNIK